jgi:multidrug efflux pump subunit AcrB
MNGLIIFSLRNPRAITVLVLTIVIAGAVSLAVIPADILPVYRSPAVQVLTFYNGMPATSVEADITNRMERWTGQAAGTVRQEGRSIVGASIIRNYYTDDTDPSAALTQVNSLATAAIPNLPPGTLPPVILPYDPTSSTPVALVALNSRTKDESTLYDTARYQVRNFIMASPGANAPVVYGGRLRTILAYLDREKMQARGLSPVDVMQALDRYNIFLPAGDAKIGWQDYALDSNSMYALVERMKDIPIKADQNGRMVYLRDVAVPRDASLVQTNIVRVDGRRQVYIPVYRQAGYSTLNVVGNLQEGLPDMQAKLTTPDVNLKLVMDQSIYVRKAIESLAEEGVLGAILCSLVILVFLGEWRMTAIAVLTIPVAVLGAIACLYGMNQTVNVMTLAGLALAIGPLVDSAIICLENTHRHLGLGAKPKEAAFLGASEVAMPELIASLCTLLVLLPLALMPGLGKFLFRPMFLAVAFAMTIAYVLSRTFVPARCAAWLRPHAHPIPIESHSFDYDHRNPHPHRKWWFTRLFEKWEALLEAGIRAYTRLLAVVLKARVAVIAAAFTTLELVVVVFGLNLRREFFPEVDAGAFEIAVRTKSGTRIEVTQGYVQAVETYTKEKLGADLELVISEIGLTADWSAAFTQNSGPMDAVLKVQLKPERERSAQECVDLLRQGFADDPRFAEILTQTYHEGVSRSPNDQDRLPPATPPFTRDRLEFAFDAGGMIRSAMNEGRSTPLNVQITGKDLYKARKVADQMLAEIRQIDGVVDARILQRMDYPRYVLEVDQSKASTSGLTQTDVMQNVVAAFNSSVQFNKRNFWIDPKSHNQYYVGVQYPEGDIKDLDTLLDIPITGPKQPKPIPLRNIVKMPVLKDEVPSEVVHTNLQPTMDLTMGVHGRDLGSVAEDVQRVVARYGQERTRTVKVLGIQFEEPDGTWTPFDPETKDHKPMEGAKIVMSGEYQKMQQTFRFQALGMIGAVFLIYFLMVALFKSYITPLVVMSAVPVGITGVVLMLFFTGTALNVQSLLGVIFMIGIVVSNTVLLTDFAENVRKSDRIAPLEAIKRAAAIRVRPVVMTALATFFALIPMSLGLSRGSEANVPLGRAVLGGLLAGLATTLLVVPCVYSLLVPNKFDPEEEPLPGESGYVPGHATVHPAPEDGGPADAPPV